MEIFKLVFYGIIIVKEICKIFIIAKAGEGFWKGLIPYYREYVYSTVIFGDSRFVLACYGPLFLLGLFFANNLHRPIFEMLGADNLQIAMIGFSCVLGAYFVGLFVWESIKVAEVFGRGKLYAAGLFFLPFIFYPLLVLNEDYYG